MSNPVELPESQKPSESPLAGELNDSVWNAWIAKGRAREQRNYTRRVKVVKLLSAAVLLATAAFWSSVTPFDIVMRFAVAVGAVVVMFQSLHARRYAVAAVFGGLALLYNPVAPAFSLTGDWQRVLVAASAIPFITSLAWREARTARLIDPLVKSPEPVSLS